ncbi:MAG: isoprenylcysteine carboxylmethyltransferase family protein [Alphaproteobacteria bacterium]|jgi:protein-S-isoprenylcysteine O-methyltransferase Ste14|nr:isoprenylcysteine carboxylmethyltransferase family protein [Alphaproteobacteria bacterium]|tara:strand:+ start:49 stop:519 length:471 start_codon:yes stop_codon:yes gene_type:complete
MEPASPDNPGVIIRPPRLYLGALALGLTLDYFKPAPWLPNQVQYPVGLAMIAAGIALAALAMRRFRAAGTNIPTPLPSTALVAGGPYRFSRNPIYLALTLIFLGLAAAANSLWLLLLLPAVLAVMHYGVVLREERYLGGKFGERYLDYKARVRRWL